MNTTKNALTQSKRIPGTGWLNYQFTQPDVRTKAEIKKGSPHTYSLFTGWLAVRTGHEYDVKVLTSTRAHGYEITLRLFPETAQRLGIPAEAWKTVAVFQLPAMGEFNYTEGQFTLGTRTYDIRMFKDENGQLRLRLPQVVRTPAPAGAIV